MLGWRFSKYITPQGKSHFDNLLELFKELLIHTSGDVSEALSWMTAIDKEHNITSPDYGMADFIDELIAKGYITDNNNEQGGDLVVVCVCLSVVCCIDKAKEPSAKQSVGPTKETISYSAFLGNIVKTNKHTQKKSLSAPS